MKKKKLSDKTYARKFIKALIAALSHYVKGDIDQQNKVAKNTDGGIGGLGPLACGKRSYAANETEDYAV